MELQQLKIEPSSIEGILTVVLPHKGFHVTNKKKNREANKTTNQPRGICVLPKYHVPTSPCTATVAEVVTVELILSPHSLYYALVWLLMNGFNSVLGIEGMCDYLKNRLGLVLFH